MNKKSILGWVVLSTLALAACSADNNKGSAASSTAQSSAQTTATSESKTAKVTIADGSNSDAEVPAKGTLVMRQLYAAPHGTQSFAAVNVLMNGDKIVAVHVDEFQYLDPADFDGVPNAKEAFGESFPKGKVLGSKEENSAAYSKLMKEKAGATQTWKESMDAITDFVAGKTVAEVKAAIEKLDKQGKNDKVSDVVSGATFTDSKGYLQAIVDASQKGMVSVGEKTDTDAIQTAQKLSAPHGDQAFAITTVAMDGDKVADVFVDEFQYVDAADFGGVPNSDQADFSKGVAKGKVLASKKANSDAYSKMMKEHGKATQTYEENAQAIADFAKGKTISEIEDAIGKLDQQGKGDKVSDVVSGATFADAKGYLQSIVDAAKDAE